MSLKVIKAFPILLPVLLLAAGSFYAQADMLVVPVNEASLPITQSPENYKLSPDNFDNSLNFYENSAENHDNSSENYDNAPTNFRNSANGDRLILMKKDDRINYRGYYVSNSNGVLNFFSKNGKRLFYRPRKSKGLYHGTEGYFCGLLQVTNDETRILLTEKGLKVLLESK